ncbi:MAG: transcription-repair coupling factor [Anaerolineae bacterium]|nr:transcription-repair coupling factor [Anaerolineae bacterium]
MQLTGLLDILRDTAPYRELIKEIRAQQPTDDLRVLRAARPFVLAALAEDWDGPVIYVTARVDRAYNVSEQLPVWLQDRPIHRFAEPTPLFYERAPWGENVIRNRISTLSALMDDYPGKAPVIITSARAIMQRTMPVNTFRRNTLTLAPGQRHAIDRLLSNLVALGYEPAQIVTEPGYFSRRGGIIDVYPIAADAPTRIEFFDDEIDSLRNFEPASQRSTGRVTELVITPAREALPDQAGMLATHLQDWFQALPPVEKDVTSPRPDLDALQNGMAFPHIEYYIPYFYDNPISLLAYAPDNALVVIEDWSELQDTIAGIEESALKARAEKLEGGLIPEHYPLPYLTWDALAEEIETHMCVHMGYAAYSDEETLPDELPDTGMRGLFVPEQRFGGQLKFMLDGLRKLRHEQERIIVVTQQAPRLSEIWHEQEASLLPPVTEVHSPPQPGDLLFVNGALQEGWLLHSPQGDTHLFSDHEIFGWSRPEPRRRKVSHRTRAPETGYADLNIGDYVVHVDYGIGRFGGMRRRTIEGNEREYLLIEYGGTDMLFVPIHQADRITRYVGPDDRPPTLSKLGKPDWIRIKSQAKKAVEEEARDLLALYAQRANAFGHGFGPDTPWQHELEASFPYVETEDQLRAVHEVKVDMEIPHPMDRLICGDVGYGKTEVALRAAFKAVMDGKQVAVLVPTTVLAQQHYENFSLRLAEFPVKVEMLSRFRTKEEQSRILPKLASGDIDIIIGTHRLLSNDITMKDLGLIIIDEEQRFGVTHKEHFKKLRTQVDVLTLTATPIPRTLFMAMSGVRDISMIQTPPEERLPIITHVGPFDNRLVRQAVLRELERGGQIFFVHNRVQSIDNARERLESVVPELRTIVAHGQMNEHTLEKVMIAFGRGDYDALVCTSIIESGIDIPNANTLIVDRADWFGMAQLYQLRGRVGRSAQQAYAYFFHPDDGRLNHEARVRLETLAENNNLGAGFQIAMRDLELRGAGDILSTRQTGHVAAIGLHLYTQLLTQTVKELKGDMRKDNLPPVAMSTVTIDLPLPAYLPTNWIPEMELRLQIYRRIGGLNHRDDVEIMRDELRDRFGLLPPAAENLMYQIDVKLLAHSAGATAVIAPEDKVLIKLPYLPDIDRERLESDLGDGITVTRTAVEIPMTNEDWQLQLLAVLERLARAVEVAADAAGM